MKKLICLCLAALLLLVNLPTVRADVIFEPMDDDFFNEHRDECAYHDRNYTAHGPNGDVTVYESPESDRVIKTVPNGEAIWISYIYKDSKGVQWGCTGDWGEASGWVPMPYLDLIYDNISFEEEYGHAFRQEHGSLDESWKGKEVRFWNYPGSRDSNVLSLLEDYLPEYDTIYVDDNGTRWGKIGYYFGLRSCWINLTAPDADFDTLYPNWEEPAQPKQPETTEHKDEIKPQPTFYLGLVVICVAAVVVVSAILLCLLKRKK